jgi:hypothetical protein
MAPMNGWRGRESGLTRYGQEAPGAAFARRCLASGISPLVWSRTLRQDRGLRCFHFSRICEVTIVVAVLSFKQLVRVDSGF